MSEHEDGGNVIEFKRSMRLEEEYDRTSSVDRLDKCRHAETKIVDEEQRTVTCKACGETVDPIWCLLKIASDWRHVHAPRLAAIREYMQVRREANEEFESWWSRIGRGRAFATKKDAARESWIVGKAPELKLAHVAAEECGGCQ